VCKPEFTFRGFALDWLGRDARIETALFKPLRVWQLGILIPGWSLEFPMSIDIIVLIALVQFVSGLWTHDAVGLFVTPMALAVAYYVISATTRRPIFGHALSLIGFWLRARPALCQSPIEATSWDSFAICSAPACTPTSLFRRSL
jgi:hypothetical protein